MLDGRGRFGNNVLTQETGRTPFYFKKARPHSGLFVYVLQLNMRVPCLTSPKKHPRPTLRPGDIVLLGNVIAPTRAPTLDNCDMVS